MIHRIYKKVYTLDRWPVGLVVFYFLPSFVFFIALLFFFYSVDREEGFKGLVGTSGAVYSRVKGS